MGGNLNSPGIQSHERWLKYMKLQNLFRMVRDQNELLDPQDELSRVINKSMARFGEEMDDDELMGIVAAARPAELEDELSDPEDD